MFQNTNIANFEQRNERYKKVKTFRDSDLFIKGISETIENEAKWEKGVWFGLKLASVVSISLEK